MVIDYFLLCVAIALLAKVFGHLLLFLLIFICVYLVALLHYVKEFVKRFDEGQERR